MRGDFQIKYYIDNFVEFGNVKKEWEKPTIEKPYKCDSCGYGTVHSSIREIHLSFITKTSLLIINGMKDSYINVNCRY